MDSPQSVVSPLKNSFISSETTKQNTNRFPQHAPINLEDTLSASLDVYVHQAREIHNICIYQKQDVYAKLCLTSDPENSVATKIINGAGRNPIFNETLRLNNVKKVDSSLKCEIWMLSRVKNYLEDQLLGLVLIPISEILLNNGELEKEFSLSSSDIFHSPAGFVHLSVSYIGATPDVIPIPSSLASRENNSSVQDMEYRTKSLPDDMDKIEFPDPKVVNENHQMVEEYYSNLDSQCSESLVSSDDTENQVSSKAGDQNEECFSTGAYGKTDSPPSSVSTNDISSQSCETPKDPKSSVEEHISPAKNDSKEQTINGSDDAIKKPHIVSVLPEESNVVQQDIVDMYMKSMQQFTESLSKMKLPGDFDSGPTSSSNSSSDPKSPASNKNTGARVYYGSRAFF